MANGFPYSLLPDAASPSVPLFPPTSGNDKLSEEATFDAIFSGVSLHSFLSLNLEPSLMPTFFAELRPFPALSISSSSPPSHISNQRCASNGDFKLPKPEPFSPGETTSCETQPFYLLPDLFSLEHPLTGSSTSSKRPRLDPIVTQSETLDSIVQSCVNFQSFTVPYMCHSLPELNSASPSPPTAPVPRSALARQRRQKLSDKTRCLQKLLPWDKNMDMATMLEETFKYVRFLQAQLLALQSMPSDSGVCSGPDQKTGSKTGAFSGLGRLNRNQLLQVLVNSPVAQTMLYSQGCCVFSSEQLGFIQKIAERKVLLKQMMFDPTSDHSSSSFHGGSYGQ